MDEEKLNELKYRQLQKLAKEHGVKANLPKAEMVKALLEAVVANQKETDGKLHLNDQDNEGQTSEEEVVESPLKSPNEKPEDSVRQVEEPTEKASSRRNSRISRLFDKEAFDVEAAKVSSFVEKMGVNSPRRRSSILTLTPVKKGETSSVSGSPLVAKFNNEPRMSSFEVQASLRKLAAANLGSAASSPSIKKTPLHKRPSMNIASSSSRVSVGKTASKIEAKKKKTVTMKAQFAGTPGSVTKAKSGTGIPRPRKVPDFAKLHAEQFGKMDTLNQYLDKKKDRIAALTPGPKAGVQSTIASAKKVVSTSSSTVSTRKSPRNQPVTEVSKANFNFSSSNSQISNAKKPFVFEANSVNSPAKPALHNITNNSLNKSSTTSYKPYSGKLKPWNPKDTLKERQQMASKTLGQKSTKEKQMSFIKGVRLNKRTELMLQKRKMNN